MTRNVGKSVRCSAPPTLRGPGTYGSGGVQQKLPGWDRDRDIKVPAITSIVGVIHIWKYEMNPLSEITHLHLAQRLLLSYGGINKPSNKSCLFLCFYIQQQHALHKQATLSTWSGEQQSSRLLKWRCVTKLSKECWCSADPSQAIVFKGLLWWRNAWMCNDHFNILAVSDS